MKGYLFFQNYLCRNSSLKIIYHSLNTFLLFEHVNKYACDKCLIIKLDGN